MTGSSHFAAGTPVEVYADADQLGEALAREILDGLAATSRPVGATCSAVPAAAACAPRTRHWHGWSRRTLTCRAWSS